MDAQVIAACAYLDIDPAQVMGSQVYEELGQVVMVVDMGIQGGKKFSVPISALPEPEPEKPKPKRRRTRKKTGS